MCNHSKLTYILEHSSSEVYMLFVVYSFILIKFIIFVCRKV